MSGEKLPHLALVFEVEFLGFKAYRLFVGKSGARLDAHHDGLGIRVAFSQVVYVIGGDKGNAGLSGNVIYSVIYTLLQGYSVILDLKIEVSVAENAV